jgi:hypothetical protein
VCSGSEPLASAGGPKDDRDELVSSTRGVVYRVAERRLALPAGSAVPLSDSSCERWVVRSAGELSSRPVDERHAQ